MPGTLARCADRANRREHPRVRFYQPTEHPGGIGQCWRRRASAGMPMRPPPPPLADPCGPGMPSFPPSVRPGGRLCSSRRRPRTRQRRVFYCPQHRGRHGKPGPRCAAPRRRARPAGSPARSSTTSGCRPCWSRSRHSRPLTRHGSSAGTLRGSDRRTTSRPRVCRRRGGHHATVLPRLRPDCQRWLPCIPLRNGECHPPSRPPSRRGEGGFSGIGRSTPMLEELVAWQPPNGGSRPVPIGSRPSV
jgi:hypothetical protein